MTRRERMPQTAAVQHLVKTQDETPYSSVVLCHCGESFLGVGPERVGQAQYAHALHRFEVQTYRAQAAVSARPPVAPVRSDYPVAPKPAPAWAARAVARSAVARAAARAVRPAEGYTDDEIRAALRAGMTRSTARITFCVGTKRINRLAELNESEREAA